MRRLKLLILAALCLALAGCSLARPEEQGRGRDKFIGVYVVPSKGDRDAVISNPYAVEYGSFEAETEFGALSFAEKALFAEEGEDGTLTFPGVERGYSLFALTTASEDPTGSQRVDRCIQVVSNMAPGEESTQFISTDEEERAVLSGTVYWGPPLGASDWSDIDSGVIWTFYRVYQTEDGRAYINGDGSSCSGSMTHTLTEDYTSTLDGKAVTESVSVSAALKTAPRLEKLTVTQFDGENAPLRSDELALRSPLPEVRCEAGAAWVLVEEESGEGTVRTVYNVPGAGEEAVSHQIILLDEEGFGELAYLSIS